MTLATQTQIVKTRTNNIFHFFKKFREEKKKEEEKEERETGERKRDTKKERRRKKKIKYLHQKLLLFFGTKFVQILKVLPYRFKPG